ncbi:homoserine O-acetyltransferase MetX [Acidihalobacter ferrooxydans]|uniref:Homoserine O-acetyltransferase n=1 Tax=Acidihalobacter ferrooxydans TaxID=1765967 RepID=A0A1P8UJJ5_9GAMM|nr:homoserine O-acetyltransferase [Acidihalobacter ferrooxydans]APZ43982.1 homoserine O-acetyltransferase [Acidihalobacter ferrooxydans]
MQTAVQLDSAPFPATPRGSRTLRLAQPFALYRGGCLENVEIAYESWGEPNAARDNAVLLFTGLSPNAHAAASCRDPSPGWWEYMIGPGKPLDTRRFYVLCINSLGSCFGSTGPASAHPADGKPYRLRFPRLALEDIARAGLALLDALHIERPAAVVGPSMGGMSALAFAFQAPERTRALALLCSTASAAPQAIAMHALQREMVMSDPAWANGNYPLAAGPVDGMRLARKLGLSCYRSPDEWTARFGRQRTTAVQSAGQFCGEFEIESYLAHNAAKFASGFDANCFLYLSRAMDDFEPAEHGDGKAAEAFARLRLNRALVVGVSSDRLFPVAEQRALAAALRAGGTPEVRFAELDSLQGHDAFLVDTARFAPVMRDFFAAL